MIGELLSMRTRYLLLVGGTALLTACAVDPYTGAVVPCCAPASAYSSPGPGGPPPGYGSPQGQAGMEAAGQGWNGSGPGPQGEMQGPGGGRGRGNLALRFAAANVTQDGRLTFAQAQAAHWRRVAMNFPAIDVGHKGFVTLDDIRSWRAANRAGQGGGGYPPPGAPPGYPPQGYSGPGGAPGQGYPPQGEPDEMEQ